MAEALETARAEAESDAAYFRFEPTLWSWSVTIRCLGFRSFHCANVRRCSRNAAVAVFEITPARHTPIRFKENEFIRVGSYKKLSLIRHNLAPNIERWRTRLVTRRTARPSLAPTRLRGGSCGGLDGVPD